MKEAVLLLANNSTIWSPKMFSNENAELLNAVQYASDMTELLGTKDFNAVPLKYAQYRKNMS